MPEEFQETWQPTSAWAGVAEAGRGGRRDGQTGVAIRRVDGGGLALLIARRSQGDLALKAKALLGLELPPAGRVACGSSCDVIWSAPGQWLVVWRQGSGFEELRHILSDLAAVTDQTSGRALLEVSGPNVRDALAKGFAIDLHPQAFANGHTAVTAVAHMSVQIWQTSDAPSFMIAIPRSFSGSFWSWLTGSAAAYGCDVTAPM